MPPKGARPTLTGPSGLQGVMGWPPKAVAARSTTGGHIPSAAQAHGVVLKGRMQAIRHETQLRTVKCQVCSHENEPVYIRRDAKPSYVHGGSTRRRLDNNWRVVKPSYAWRDKS